MNRSWGRRVFEVLSPLIIYEGLCIVVQSIISTWWAVGRADQFLNSDYSINQQALMDALVQFTTKYGLMMQGIAAAVSIVILYKMYLKDYVKRRFVFDRSSIPPVMWAFLVPVGICLSISANMLINIGPMAEESQAFQNSAAILFSGPVILQFVFIGFVIPACEELIFRGLIFMRMRQYANVNAAILVQALIFALMHGNMLQGIYGFILGILLAYSFEKYGSLKAPILIHISSNLVSLVLAYTVGDTSLLSNDVFLAVAGCAAAAVSLLLVWILDKRVEAKRVYLDVMTRDEDPGSGSYADGNRYR